MYEMMLSEGDWDQINKALEIEWKLFCDSGKNFEGEKYCKNILGRGGCGQSG